MQLLNKAVGTHWRLFISKLYLYLKHPSSESLHILNKYFNVFISQLFGDIKHQYSLMRAHNKIVDRLIGNRTFIERCEEFENNSCTDEVVIIGNRDLKLLQESYVQE